MALAATTMATPSAGRLLSGRPVALLAWLVVLRVTSRG
jgi:hypothetical protein